MKYWKEELGVRKKDRKIKDGEFTNLRSNSLG